MIYNPKDPMSRKAAYQTFSECMEGEEIFEITRKKVRRTLPQNSYLHLLLAYFALEYGCRKEYAKLEFYKKTVNPDIFVYPRYDRIKDCIVEEIRSSKELTKEEMSLSIERFKIWSVQEAGILLPDAEDKENIQQAEMDTKNYRAKIWI